jgi:hypothetical protein
MFHKRLLALFVTLSITGCAVEANDAGDAEGEALGTAQQALVTPKYTVDAPADFANGSCVANGNSLGRCNLRAAIAAAQSKTGDVIVELAADPVISLGQIFVAGDSQPRIKIQSNLPDSRRASITGSSNSRLFTIYGGASVTLYNLSIQAFKSTGFGGALENYGTLSIVKSIIANSKSECGAVGAQTAFASCGGGAVWNGGTLTVSQGSRFESNRVDVQATTAANVNSFGYGGAIGSTGTLTIQRPVAFVSNAVVSSANAGFHGSIPSSAYATASGGALSASGTFSLTGTATCDFLSNSAKATAAAIPPGPSQATSQGGAISVSSSINTTGCTFAANSASIDPNVHVGP